MTDNFQPEPLSYALGGINAFAEVVAAGVKPLGLSSPLEPEQADFLFAKAKDLAHQWGVQIYHDRDFLVTDLFPASFTRGKHVLVLSCRKGLEGYHQLKKQKQKLLEMGAYEGDLRRGIAQQFGILLGYPQWKIEQLLGR